MNPQFSTFSTEYQRNSTEIVNLINNFTDKKIQIFDVKNCPNTSEAAKLISNPSIWSALDSLKNFKAIRLKVNKKLNVQYAEKPKAHEFNSKRNYLIVYESTVETNQKIIFWNNGKPGNFVAIRLIKEFSAELTEFVLNFMIEIVDLKLNGEIFI